MLQHSRRDGRVGPDGELLTIAEQDRRRWKRSEIARAGRELRAARGRGPYVLQASIAEVHATAESAAGNPVGPHRPALRRAARRRTVPGRGAQPGDRGRDVGRPRRRPRLLENHRSPSRGATGCSPRRGPTRSPRRPAGRGGPPLPPALALAEAPAERAAIERRLGSR